MDAHVAIRFHYYRTRIIVGPDSLTGFSGTYSNSTGINYINKFGIVEIPLNLRYYFLSSLPLSISIGASYGHLLKSNALTFNPSANNYRYDVQNMVKNYLGFSCSLQYQLLSK